MRNDQKHGLMSQVNNTCFKTTHAYYQTHFMQNTFNYDLNGSLLTCQD
jgi:hypothetical protein